MEYRVYCVRTGKGLGECGCPSVYHASIDAAHYAAACEDRDRAIAAACARPAATIFDTESKRTEHPKLTSNVTKPGRMLTEEIMRNAFGMPAPADVFTRKDTGEVLREDKGAWLPTVFDGTEFFPAPQFYPTQSPLIARYVAEIGNVLGVSSLDALQKLVHILERFKKDVHDERDKANTPACDGPHDAGGQRIVGHGCSVHPVTTAPTPRLAWNHDRGRLAVVANAPVQPGTILKCTPCYICHACPDGSCKECSAPGECTGHAVVAGTRICNAQLPRHPVTMKPDEVKCWLCQGTTFEVIS